MNIQTLNKLRIDAKKGIQNALNELEKQSTEFEIDEFNGYKREDFIIKFNRFEYNLNESGEKEFVKIKLGIYIKDKDGVWLNSLEPIGDYVEVYDCEGRFIDEFITIESKEKKFGITNWIEILNKVIPNRYYKINIPEYEFVTYINHTISLFQGRNFEGVFIFLKRCLDYLEIQKQKELLDKRYLDKTKEYLKSLYFYLKNNGLIDREKIEEYNIEKRINPIN